MALNATLIEGGALVVQSDPQSEGHNSRWIPRTTSLMYLKYWSDKKRSSMLHAIVTCIATGVTIFTNSFKIDSSAVYMVI